MKAPRDRGRWGRWLREERLKRDLSPEQVRALLAARGYRVGESSYAEWESGYKRQPTREAIPHLVAIFGSEPEPEPEPAAAPDLSALIAQIAAQTQAMTELTEELRRATATQDQGFVTLAELAGTVARLLDRVGTRDASELIGDDR